MKLDNLLLRISELQQLEVSSEMQLFNELPKKIRIKNSKNEAFKLNSLNWKIKIKYKINKVLV